jgi:Tfp pilus assembly protein PilX
MSHTTFVLALLCLLAVLAIREAISIARLRLQKERTSQNQKGHQR